MRVRTIVAGTLLGGAAGFCVGGVASEAYLGAFPKTNEASVTSSALSELETTGANILIILPTLGGLASGAVIALSKELTMHWKEEPTVPLSTIIQSNPNTV